MADVNAEIGVSINTSNALAQLKALQREIARFHTSVAKTSETAALAQRDLQRNFLNGVNAIQGFSAELRTVKTTAESFTNALEKNKFSMREYFRYSMASTKTFGRFFRTEFDTINKVSLENVKKLQTQYIKMGRDATGAMKAIAIMPTKLDLTNYSTQTQIAAQRQALFNQLVKQGSTNLLNFGKNTQWAGRQLMVGFTLPLIGLGAAATKTFMEMETATIKFRKVYGDLFTPVEERDKAFQDLQDLAREFSKYGIAISETITLGADAAAAGFQGLDLQRQVTEATRLQVLGQIDQQKALETTISLQNAFRMSSEDLADAINFLNAVENQTVVSLDDITTAIPKAAPIVQELGGDVKDLAFFMAAMKEGGINASEGANALKSGLASLINPTNKAKEMLQGFGIDIDAIVEKNVGNVKQTVIDFAFALDDLSSLSRQRAIEQLFGKFQQARLSALFSNVIRDGNQASRVLDLAGTSMEELASLAEGELGITANSAMNKFRSSVENLKASLAPVGQLFLEIVTPFIENLGGLFDKFNSLSAGTKKAITALVIGIGAIAPVVLMTVGLFANFVANGIKGLMLLRNGYLRLTGQSQILSEQTNFLTDEQQRALAAAASLEQSHMNLKQVFTAEAESVRQLVAEYQRMIAAQNTAATRFPAMMQPGFKVPGYSDGIVSVPGPKGAGDVVPAMLSPGEAVISAPLNEKYAPLVQGIIADNIPGYANSISSVEKFVGTRAGRSASAGERAQVNLPGGYQLGHFAEPIRVTGAELRRLAEEQTQGFKDVVEKMIASVNGDLEAMFDVFTNQVTVQSKEFNQALGEVGSGRIAPKEMFIKEAVTQAGAYNAPLIREMQNAGASAEEVNNAVKQLATEFEQGISDLGDVAGVTAEQVNEITKRAYERVSEVNDKVRIANEKLSDPGALKEIVDVTGGRRSFRGGYNLKTTKQDINEIVQAQAPGLYPTQQAFNFTGEAARNVGIQNARAIREIYNQLSEEAKARVIELVGDIDALSQQVVLEAKNAGIDIGRYAIQGIAEGTAAASPSQEAKKQGQNVSDGFEQGILEGKDDAAMAASQVKDAALAELGSYQQETIQFGVPLGRGPLTFEQEALPLDLNAQPAFTPVQQPVTEALEEFESVTIQAAEITNKSGANMQKWNSRLMAGSFAMSSITGVMGAFGKDLGGVGDKLFKISTALFAFQSVVQLATQAQLLNIASQRLSAAKQASAFATYGAGMASRAGIAGLVGRIGVFAKTLLGLTTPLGIAINAAVLVGTTLYVLNKRAEENRKRIDGLGEAALAAGKKIEGLADYFGVNEDKFGFETYDFEKSGGGLLPAQQESEVQKLIQSEMFKNFQDTVEAVRNATQQEATLALESLALGLESKGFSQEQVNLIIEGILKEAGRRDIVIDFNSIDISSAEGKEAFEKNLSQIFNRFNKKLSKGVNDSFRKTLGLTSNVVANALGALENKLTSGKISAEEYTKQVADINKQILNIKDSAQQANLIQTIFKVMGEDAQKAVKGVSDVSDKLLIMQAVLMNINSEWIKVLGDPDSDLLLKDIARRKILEQMGLDLNDLTEKIKEFNDESGNGNGGTGKGITLQERLIKIYEKERQGLEKKLKALQDVNEEINRQNEYIQDQMDLTNQITEAKISGNYLEAAALTQQRLMKQVEFRQESKEIELQKQIDSINDRISQLEDKDRKLVLTNAERRMLRLYENRFRDGKAGKPPGNKPKPTDKKETEPTKESPKTMFFDPSTFGYKKPGSSAKTRTIPSPPPYDPTNPSRDFYFNVQTGKWERYQVSRQPKDAVSRREWMGGVKYYKDGGPISGPGTSTSDSIPVMASDGEFMWSAAAVENAGGANAVASMHKYFKNAQKLKDGGPVVASKLGKRDPNQSFLNRLIFGTKYVGGNMSFTKGEVPFAPGGLSKAAMSGLKNYIGLDWGKVALEQKLALKGSELQDAILKNILKNESTVFRGTKNPEILGAKIGDIVGEPSIASTSKDLATALGFAIGGGKGTLLKLKLPSGVPALDVGGILGKEGIETLDNAAEMILAAGQKFKITNIIEKDFPELGVFGAKVIEAIAMLPKLAGGGYISMASLPKFKTGIDNVPYDMPAILHQGERVLTKEENKEYGSGSSTVNATFNITGDNPRDIANQVMLQLERLSNKNNKSNKVFG